MESDPNWRGRPTGPASVHTPPSPKGSGGNPTVPAQGICKRQERKEDPRKEPQARQRGTQRSPVIKPITQSSQSTIKERGAPPNTLVTVDDHRAPRGAPARAPPDAVAGVVPTPRMAPRKHVGTRHLLRGRRAAPWATRKRNRSPRPPYWEVVKAFGEGHRPPSTTHHARTAVVASHHYQPMESASGKSEWRTSRRT